jgi:outer membrane protein assembly factor BamB
MEMSSENPVAARKVPSIRLAALARLGTALALTFGVLLYAYGRTLILGMLLGQLQWLFLALTVAAVVVVFFLTRGLAPPPPTPLHRIGAVVGLLAWVVASWCIIWFYSADVIPRELVALLFVTTTLWVGWLAWLPFWPLPWGGRLSVLALLILLGPVFPVLVKASGLTGDASLEFSWRWQSPPEGPPASSGQGLADSGEPVRLTPLGPDDFPQLLGPHRDGILPKVRLSRDWAGHPPRLLWRKQVGAGWGAFAVGHGFAVTQEQRGEQECVVCYRVKDGAEAWVHADSARFESGYGGLGPRATPTIADGRVYSVGATGILNCLEGATGHAVWSINVLDDNDAGNLTHGVCASPLVMGRLVLVCPTGTNGISLAAYDRDTGKRVWRGGHERASYASPALVELEGVRQVLLYQNAGVSGHDPKTGNVLWTFPWENYEHIHSSQPIVISPKPAQVFVSTGYGKGSALFGVEHKDGSWSTNPVWDAREMKTKFTTPVLYKGSIYGLDDGILACLDPQTGDRRWKQGRYGHGQVLLAGDLLLIQAENGGVVLVEPSAEGPHELGRIAALTGKTWNNLALAGRYLLVRNNHEAACYEVALESP